MDYFFSLLEHHKLFVPLAWLVMVLLALGAVLLLVRLVQAVTGRPVSQVITELGRKEIPSLRRKK